MTMTYLEFFKDKKVTLMGLGLLGRGVGDAEFLAQCGAQMLVTDLKTDEKLAPSIEYLKKYPNVTFHLGGHIVDDFENTDMVIKAAGVPLDSLYVKAARGKGVPVYMSGALCAKFAAEAGATVIGATGTRGKSTVAHLLHHVLKKVGKPVHLGGNIRGVSTLALLPEIKKGDILILELDSWQLQGFGDLHISPHIAIFTNLLPDHMNYYPDMGTYLQDKSNIFRFQKDGDYLFVGTLVLNTLEGLRPPVAPHTATPLKEEWQLRIPGAHNRENAALAAAALKALGLTVDDIRSGIESFEGLEGRLQFVGEKNGVKIYNDNSATTPDATIVALRALGDVKRNIVLIMGGDEKWLDMSALLSEIPKWCSKVVLFKERGTERIREEVLKLDDKGVRIFEEEGLPATVEKAFSVAQQGEIILYSPAFSSFGKYFKNEFDRSDQFVTLVHAKL